MIMAVFGSRMTLSASHESSLPRAITAKFLRNAIDHKLKDVLSFIAVDEVHLIEDCVPTFILLTRSSILSGLLIAD